MTNRSILMIGLCAAVFMGSFFASGCQSFPAFGREVLHSPVVALVHETGDGADAQPSGIVYREVLNVGKLLSAEEILLFAFMDDKTTNETAIPFIETLADRFSGQLLVIRVNPDAPGDLSGLIELETLFGIREYPCFILVQGAKTKASFTSYNADIENDLTQAVYRLLP